MITTRKIITLFGFGIGLLAALILLLGLASPAKALQPLNQDQPEVWNAAAPIPEPRAANLVQCPEDPEGFYLVGGVTTGNITVDTLYHYDAISNTWAITLTTMPQPRRAVAAACYQGKIYVAGGWNGVPLDTFYIYDVAGDSWSSGPSLPDVLWGAALGAWDGRLYLVGGTRGGSPYLPVNRVDVYDIASGMWSTGGGTSMPTAASFYGAVQRGPYLFAVGGASGNFNNNVNQTQRYDMASNTWEIGPEFASRRSLIGISMTGARLYAQGGDLNGGGSSDVTDLVEVMELSGWPGGAWTDLGDPLPLENIYPAGACTEAVTGGEIWGVGGGLDTITIYSPNLYRPAEPCLGYTYTLALAPDSQSGEGYRGGTVDYTLTVTNTGDTPDAYTLSFTSTWTTTVSGLGGALDPGQGRLFTVTVEIPYTATLGASDVASITITSPGDPIQTANAVITTTAVTDWVEAARIPEPLAANLVQCSDDPEGFYLVGGVTARGSADTLYHYAAISNTWTITLTTMPQPRRAVAVACYQGKIYVAGGWETTPRNSFYIYDIAGDSWSTGPSLPSVIWGAALGAWDGKLYLAGGTRVGSPYPPVDRVDVYDIASGIWTPGEGTPMPTAATFFGTVQRGPYLFAVGGTSGNLNFNVNQTQRYDLASDTWEIGPEFTSRRSLIGISMTGARLYAQGGDPNGGGDRDGTDLVEYLDLSTWLAGTWDLGDPLPQDNLYPAGACTEAITGGETWAVGGADSNTIPYNTNLYHPAEPCLGYNYTLSLIPAAQSGEGYRGGTVDYTLTVTNTGDTPDAYTIDLTRTWTTTVSGLDGALDPDQSRAFTVTVEVPAGAALGESDLATLTLTSQGDPAQLASAALTTTAAPRYAVVLNPGAAEQIDYQGALVTYTLQLTNTGDVTDTFTLAAGEAGWTVTLPVTETTLTFGEGTAVIVHVAIPAGAPDGDMDIVIITATSQGDPLVFASSTLTTAVWRRTYLPLITSN